jgi:hypothetical protein
VIRTATLMIILFSVGLCKLNSLTHSLKAPGFRVISYRVIFWFQNVHSRFNLRQYISVLTVGGGCHTLVEKLDLRAPSRWTDLDEENEGGVGIEGGGGGIESGGGSGGGGIEGGVVGSGSRMKGGECGDDDGPNEALMPEFRVETFEAGMAKLVRGFRCSCSVCVTLCVAHQILHTHVTITIKQQQQQLLLQLQQTHRY